MAFATTLLLLSTAFASSKEKIITSFSGAGVEPQATLVSDAAGNLYGTTIGPWCPPACGEVFELSPTPSGAFKLTVLHVFRSRNGDGIGPYGGLVLDSGGNLFGTTALGGSTGNGIVFELSPSPTGWTYSVLYNFSGSDGRYSRASMVLDAAGNLYGTTYNGGSTGSGVAFELSPSPTGWTENVLHDFASFAGDGALPQGAMIFDSAGNLYGTTAGGGNPACYLGCGTVFKLSNTGGNWTETQIYLFGGFPNDGATPLGPLVFDKTGNLYGSTIGGGSSPCTSGAGCGTVFELTRSGGVWTESILHTFTGPPDGNYPYNGLVFDAAGNLFGTTYQGGDANLQSGTIFELSFSGGSWTETVVHTFLIKDGADPLSGLLFEPSGILYGTTSSGGAHGVGTAFGFKP